MPTHVWFGRATSLRDFIAFAVALFTANLAAAATIVGGPITSNTTWNLAGSPYLAMTQVGINSGVTLTIEPGVVVKFSGVYGRMVVFSGGTLTAVGTSGSRIIFTSMQDDSVGGDSGSDGATVGAPGQWYSIIVSGAGQATLRYADVRYGGYGSANEAYGGITVQTGGIADLDYCALYMNQRSGITVGINGMALIAHSQLTQNANGASGYNAALIISANSSLSSNSHTGLFLNVGSTYTGTPASITNSDIANNGEFGVRLIMNSDIPASATPSGHDNNIFNNKSGDPQRQLWVLWPVVQSDWTGNYWGPVSDVIPCPWAPPQTTGYHLAPSAQVSYCVPPPDGPVGNAVYVAPGCPGGAPKQCRADWVNNLSHRTSPVDNSGM